MGNSLNVSLRKETANLTRAPYTAWEGEIPCLDPTLLTSATLWVSCHKAESELRLPLLHLVFSNDDPTALGLGGVEVRLPLGSLCCVYNSEKLKPSRGHPDLRRPWGGEGEGYPHLLTLVLLQPQPLSTNMSLLGTQSKNLEAISDSPSPIPEHILSALPLKY